MRKIHLLICLGFVLLLGSCDIQKEAAKASSDINSKENIETTVFRKGDTVRYIIPKVKFKDTTIVRVNRQGTTIQTVYNKEGEITSVDCFASAIAEIKKENREFQQSLMAKEAKKSEEFNSTWILYIALGIVIIACFALFLAFLYIKQKL